MSKIRSIVFGTSLFATLAFAVIGGTGINSTMAAPSATDGQGCIIAILKSEKAQQATAIAPSSESDPGCIIAVRKAGGDGNPYPLHVRKAGGGGTEYNLHVRKAGGDQQGLITVRKAGGDQHEY
jgi:hypothetical protein